MHRLVAVLFFTFVTAAGAAGCSSSAPSCSPTFTPCGGSLVGTWTYESACGASAVAMMQCPGASVDVAPNVSGTYTFNADGTYSTNLTIEESGTETVPASCLGGVTACAQLDATLNTGGLTIALTSCSGTASQSCTCTVSVSGTLTQTGKYATAGNDFSVTPSGGAAGMPTGYCVAGSTLEIGAGSSTASYAILTKQ
jgi:hypothetical protein